MTTTVYFIRHAQPDFSIKDDRLRPLTQDGLRASLQVTRVLEGHRIDRIFSSPYKRAYDTILDLSRQRGLPITPLEDFRERRVDSVWVDDFETFARRQWADFDFKLRDGESLREVQQRNVATLQSLLDLHPDESFAVGTHGTALSTIFNHFEPDFGFEAFWSFVDKMPCIVRLTFKGQTFLERQTLDLP